MEIEGKRYDPFKVIEKLKQQVTAKRWQRIQGVVEKRNPNFITVMENIYDRGNTSAVMRSAEAFGFHLFHQIVELDSFKESKRVTQGADKWLLQTHWDNTSECIKSLKSKGYRILVTHLEGGTPIDQVAFDQPTALCFGNERDGVSSLLTELADEKVFLPMHGFVQSFNISVAAALCFQHIFHEMKQRPLRALSDEERQELTALYLYRSCKTPLLP